MRERIFFGGAPVQPDVHVFQLLTVVQDSGNGLVCTWESCICLSKLGESSTEYDDVLVPSRFRIIAGRPDPRFFRLIDLADSWAE
jgi:hypothetical protein